jgi:hypothetical protein
MNGEIAPSIAQLAAADPAAVDQRRGSTPQAQSTLARILSTERESARRLRWPRRRVVAVMIAATVLAGCGAALRAADPFGFWRSSAPDTASFAVSPGDRVVAPRASGIGCRLGAAKTLTCTPGGGGIRYSMIHASTFAAVPAWFSRASALRTVAKEFAAGRISARGARVLRGDLKAVPASFFPDFRELGRFQTLESQNGSNGTDRVPPHGVPLLIACQQLRAAIDCEELNGDEATPVGAGIYSAVPEPDWITIHSPSPNAELRSSQRLILAVFGHPLTQSELRLLMDLARSATGGQSGGTASGHSAPVVRGRAPG